MENNSVPIEALAKDDTKLFNLLSALRVLGIHTSLNFTNEGVSADMNYIDKEGSVTNFHTDEDGELSVTFKKDI